MGGAKLETAGSLRGGKMGWALASIQEGFTINKTDHSKGYVLLTSPHEVGKSITVRTIAGDPYERIIDHERAVLLEDEQRAARVADDHAHDGVIDRVAGGDGVDVDLGFAEGVAHAGEGARAVVEEDGELLGQVHRSADDVGRR